MKLAVFAAINMHNMPLQHFYFLRVIELSELGKVSLKKIARDLQSFKSQILYSRCHTNISLPLVSLFDADDPVPV